MASVLRSRLAELDWRIALLQAERDTVATRLAAVVYPVLSLPNEIVTQIFLHYGDGTANLKAALCVASVCRVWRAIDLSTSGLWKRFNLHPRLADCAETWLARSGVLALDVHLILDDELILQALEQYLPRVENLTLVFDPPVLRRTAQLGGPFTALESLSLKSGGTIHHVMLDVPVVLHPAFADAPNLRSVSIDGILLDNWQDAFPWTQLTKLETRFIDIEWCLQLLKHTPCLEILICALDLNVSSLTTPHRLLPRLHTIDLRENRTNKFLAYLTLPALDRMYLASDLIERSRCAPTVLHMSLRRDLEFYEFRECLWTLGGSVGHLELEGPGGSSDAFNRLFAALSSHVHSGSDDDEDLMLPQLVSLAITSCSTDIQLRPLVNMLEARRLRRSAVKLDSFTLSFSHHQRGLDEKESADVDMVERDAAIRGHIGRLARLRSQGLELELSSAFEWCGTNVDSHMVQEINTLSSGS
ncbi:hypothetical protein FB45DRAFT_935678 [Roridomyces roridus]|uniref:F-box domain-containing protein n=1 Tax=Roridomyces roridus TaxID=1738132 RepID=A0AAD7BB80_9AGAR|nr:hypothetical protein FB45DRAFT_935678 [Roridomyces roridus]